jgi:hypothetical protein
VFDTAGRRRASIAGAGNVEVFDTNGKLRTAVTAGEVNMFDSSGTLRMAAGYSPSHDRTYVSIYDENGAFLSEACPARATLHQRADASYGVEVCDADGNVIYTAP